MTKYTVFDANDASNIFGRGLTAVEAMEVILTDDGYRFEIRKSVFLTSVCWDLYRSDGSANSTRGARDMVKTFVFSFIEDEAQAEQEIAKRVIEERSIEDSWRGLPCVMTDTAFDEVMAEIAADEEE